MPDGSFRSKAPCWAAVRDVVDEPGYGAERSGTSTATKHSGAKVSSSSSHKETQ